MIGAPWRSTDQTRRNSNRTGSRNAAGMKELLSRSSKLVLTSFYYQYCAYRSCHSFEAVIADRRTENFTYGLQERLIQAGLAVMTVGHKEEDVHQEHPVNVRSIGENKAYADRTMSWDDLSDLLLRLHQIHVKHSSYRGCKDFDEHHLGYARDRADDEDLSISNVLRDIPGVRHLDTDGLFLCPNCAEPTLVIEATSDGYENDTFKSTYMSERLANLLGMDFALVQHPRGSIDQLVLTRNVLVPDNHKGHYRKATTVMAPDEFLGFLEEARFHECRSQ